MIFCDTSTVAKLYVPEHESKAVKKRLEAEDEVYVSEVLRPELMGVFHRRVGERKWSHADFLVAVRQFTSDDFGGFWTWLALDATVTKAAATAFTTLPDDVYLRSADCLHLVTAVQQGFSEIHTHDRHQATAASIFGLTPVALS